MSSDEPTFKWGDPEMSNQIAEYANRLRKQESTPSKLEHLTRTNHEDTYVLFNRLVDVINAMSERLCVVESELMTQRGRKVIDEVRQAHTKDNRRAKPV